MKEYLIKVYTWSFAWCGNDKVNKKAKELNIPICICRNHGLIPFIGDKCILC